MDQDKKQSEIAAKKIPICDRMALIFTVKDDLCGLKNVLRVLEEKKINLLHIESRKSRENDSDYEIYVDLEKKGVDEKNLVECLQKRVSNVVVHEPSIRPLTKTVSLDRGDTKYTSNGIPWFPKTIADLDQSANRVLMYGVELDADHPGFKDPVYRKRRKEFVDIAFNYKHGQPIPIIKYTPEEIKTWGTIFQELRKLYQTHACREFLQNLPLLEENCGYRINNIPQLEDISNYLKKKTGFQLRPVAGYLSSRDFLAGLAFRVFHCTQYIRHGADPFYSPEPDCCHEMLGHMPLFLDPSFAEFSQEIGLASLGASDEEVQKLATCYFFTVEFGLCRQNGEMRVYGAGLLSSISELKHVLTDRAVIKPFDPEKATNAVCQISTFQDQYFYTNSMEEAKEKLRHFAHTILRPFEVLYDPYLQAVQVLDTPRTIFGAVSCLQHELIIVANAVKKLDLGKRQELHGVIV